jgi:hypothetical protein
MKPRLSSPAVGLVLALGSAVAGCGSDEMFTLQLGSNERLIDTAATARFANSDRMLDLAQVVGDLDGDGVDDAIIRTGISNVHDGTVFTGIVENGTEVYVLYGGPGATGSIDLASLPVLTRVSALIEPLTTSVTAVGDVDGDGLADFLITIASMPSCGAAVCRFVIDAPPVGGVYLVYGSTTRLAGSHPISDVAVLLNDPVINGHENQAVALGDIDGDGKADFAIATLSSILGEHPKLSVFYGRAQRLSGTVDLAATADAVIDEPAAEDHVYAGPKAARIGDVDGDGYADFVAELPVNMSGLDVRLVRGSATRLTGTVALPDIGHTQLPGSFPDHCETNAPAFALGDLDGDGADDFALTSCQLTVPSISAYSTTFHVLYGRKAELPAQLSAADAVATVTTAPGDLPDVMLSGDLDGDGVRDLILSDGGLHGYNGAVHILKGGPGRLSGTIDLASARAISYVGWSQRVPQCSENPCVVPERVGFGVGLGDLTGDHRPELLIGAPSDFSSGVQAPDLGHTYILSTPVLPNE